MKMFLQPLMALVAYGLVRSIDLAVSAAIAKSTVRAIAYFIVTIFLLLIVVIALFGV